MANIEYSEQEQIRRESLAKLRELGIEPYPAALYPVNECTKNIADNFPKRGIFLTFALQDV